MGEIMLDLLYLTLAFCSNSGICDLIYNPANGMLDEAPIPDASRDMSDKSRRNLGNVGSHSGSEKRDHSWISAEAYGADPSGIISSDVALDTAVLAAGGGCVIFGPGQFRFTRTHNYPVPICILGVGKGVGPGPAAHSNISVTEFMIDSRTSVLFNVTSNVGSRFENFRCNTSLASRPAYTNGCIRLSGDVSGTVANPIIRSIATTQVARPIEILRPNWPVITESYFDGWAGLAEADAAIYCHTTAGIEGSCGFISHNYFFGTGSSGPALFSEVGYTDFHDNTVMTTGITIHFKYRNFPAGYTKVHDNTIENFGASSKNGLMIETGDGSAGAYVMIQNNEFFPTIPTKGSIFIADNPSSPSWLDQLIISGNSIRETTVTEGSSIRVGAGNNIQIANNNIREEGANWAFGINVTGVTTDAGISAPVIIKDNTLNGKFKNKYVLTNSTNVVWSDPTGSTVGVGGSQLPSFAGRGSEAMVIDGAAGLSIGVPVVGGGSSTYKVFYNGSSWTVSGK